MESQSTPSNIVKATPPSPQQQEAGASHPMVKIFQSLAFKGKAIRWVVRDGEPWWVHADACRALGIQNPSSALSRLKSDERMTLDSTEGHSGQRGGAQSLSMVNEAGLYRLILGSRKADAEEFKRWVTHEVLPSIRKTGGYQVRPRTFREVASEALRLAGEEVLALEHQVEEQRPKVEFYDLLVSRGVGLDFGQCARAINVPGVTRRTLYALMRQEGVLFQNECGEDELDHQYIDEGLFAYENAPYYRNGFLLPHQKPVAMPAGLDYLKELVARRDDSGIFDTPLSFLGPTESK